MTAGPRQKIRAAYFDKNFRAKCLPRIDSHMVMLTVVQDITQRCCEKTDTTPSITNKVSVQYYGGHTVGTDKINLFSITASLTI